MKKKSMLVLALSASVVCSAQAATPNDAGISVNPDNFDFRLAPVVQSSRGVAICPPTGPVAASFTGATTQMGRIFRDAIPSVCPSKVYPGIFGNATVFNYETFTYTNTSAAAACVTVNFDPDAGATPCATNAHASAYVGSYDPANQAANYVGDVGSSITQPFAFEVPANQNMVLVVTNTASAAICDFAFEVVNLPCTTGTPTLAASTTTLAFGSQVVGSGVLRTLTLSNVGTAALNVTTIGAPTAPFTLTAGGTCGAVPFSLAPDASCTLIYQFSPAATGSFNSTVAIDSNGGSLNVTLTGSGVVPVQLNALSHWSTGLLLALFGLSTLVLVRRRG